MLGRAEPTSLEALPRLWRSLDVTAEAALPPSFDVDWSIGGRVRGALGHVLHNVPDLEEPRARARRERLGLPSAFELIYAPRFMAPERASQLARAPVRPVLLAARAEKRRLRVTIRLFGAAMLYQRQIELALRRTLEGGIAVAAGARSRARLEPVKIEVTAPPLESAWLPADSVRIVFRTPLALLRGDWLRADPDAVLGSLVSRIAALAAWQGIALETDPALLAAELQRLQCSWQGGGVVGWQRRSMAQPQRQIPMTGYLGSLLIEGDMELWRPALQLAPVSHIGSHTTFGMGEVALLR